MEPMNVGIRPCGRAYSRGAAEGCSLDTKQAIWTLVVKTPLEADVRFLIVGGWAKGFHDHKHVADDHLFVEFSTANWSKLRIALAHPDVAAGYKRPGAVKLLVGSHGYGSMDQWAQPSIARS